MTKKTVMFIVALMLVFSNNPRIFAEDNDTSSSVIALRAKTQNVFGTVGKVDYVDFKSRGDSTLVVKDNKGESVKVSLKELI